MMYSGEMQVLIEGMHIMIVCYEYFGVNFKHRHKSSAKNEDGQVEDPPHP